MGLQNGKKIGISVLSFCMGSLLHVLCISFYDPCHVVKARVGTFLEAAAKILVSVAAAALLYTRPVRAELGFAQLLLKVAS